MAGASGPRLKGDPTVDGRDAPWVEKYRPKTLDDVAAHKEIIETSKCLTRRFSCMHVTHAPCPGMPEGVHHSLRGLSCKVAGQLPATLQLTTNHRRHMRLVAYAGLGVLPLQSSA